MRLDQELTFGIGLLLALQLLTAFAAIGLFLRMGPVVSDIIEDYGESLQAGEEILAALAEAPAVVHEAAAREALVRARQAVTAPGEPEILDRVEQSLGPALAGDPVARSEVVAALRELAILNHLEMQREEDEARAWSRAGAWAAALLGLVTFLLGQVIYRRLRGRIERPLREVDAALVAARLGDVHRRCGDVRGSRELRRIAQNVDWALDRLLLEGEMGGEDGLRVALLHLLDEHVEPTLLVDAHEGVVAMNQAALSLLDQEEREAGLLDMLRAGQEPEGWTLERVGTGTLKLARQTGG